MGVVWRAVDEELGREVAVKELRTFTDAGGPELADLRARMRREARAAARVRHPGVIAVYDVAQHEGRPVIVMELVEGPSLDDELADGNTLDPVRAAAVGARVLDALAAAHRVGVLHRDVKPGNILLERGGRVVLTDFGIAAMDNPGDDITTRLTGSGELVGSLDYLAPERARGGEPGPPSDVWALGATLYAAVEGASPFRRTSTWSTLTAIVTEPLPEPRRAGVLGPALVELLRKDPAERADAERAAALLNAVVVGAGPDTATLRAGPGRAAPDPGPVAAPGPPGAEPDTSPDGEPPRQPAVLGEFGPPPELDTDRHTVRTASGPAGGHGQRRLLTGVLALALVCGAAVASWALWGGGDEERAAPPEPSASTGPSAPHSPSPDGEGSAGSSGSGGSGEDEPPLGCRPLTRTKVSCEVWREAPSYDAEHRRAGKLKAGKNYFYCQRKFPHRETFDRWTNVWWARTDDDSGNSGVFVSAVYLKGGKNDRPVPGLPRC
ncbi:serine/threonine protein kinase [Streptomyces sp. AJS327]|nr:serine/threonine protein kinase [Streptomyces sp. AJS327]